MKTDKLIKIIKNTHWWVEESPASFFLFDYIMRAFTAGEKIIGYPYLRHTLAITKDNIGQEITPYKEKREAFLKIYRRELKEPGYFNKILKGWAPQQLRLLVLNKEAMARAKDYSALQLIKFIKKYMEAVFQAAVYGTFIECVDPFTEGLAKMMVKKYALSGQEANDAITVLSTPTRRSFLTEEKVSFCRLCLKEISPEKYWQKFFWIATNYRESRDITLKGLEQRVRREIKNKGQKQISQELRATYQKEKDLAREKKEILKKISLDKQDKVLFKLLEQFSLRIDIRKESMIRASYTLDKLLKIVSQRVKYSMDDLRSMRESEVLEVLAGGKVDIKKIRQRHKLSVAYYTPRSQEIYYGEEAKKLYQIFQTSQMISQIKGTIVSGFREIFKGRVSRVMDVYRDKFRPGDILVTSMTRPEFMPILRRASAVITDEGGVTCHAAIVARELGIPGIVGTKNATKMLKSGDMVEVDANSGIIKKLNK